MINLVELKRWRDFTETIPAEMIAMECWRQGSRFTPKCDSVGCIVGHCTGLYQADELPRDNYGIIEFNEVTSRFLGITSTAKDVWKFLFDSAWGYQYYTDTCGTQKAFALHRMDYVLKHGDAPRYWVYDRAPYDRTPSDFVI